MQGVGWVRVQNAQTGTVVIAERSVWQQRGGLIEADGVEAVRATGILCGGSCQWRECSRKQQSDPQARRFVHSGIRNLPLAIFQLKLKNALEGGK